MRFAGIMEHLGVSLNRRGDDADRVSADPLGLSAFVTELPVIGEVPQALVFVAILWSIFGTGLLALAGIRLPGLEFRNQRVEAAYRKELVYGRGPCRPRPAADRRGAVRQRAPELLPAVSELPVLQHRPLRVPAGGGPLAYIALGPTIVAAGFTLGVMQQIVRAFGRVENSFQYLVNSWTTIVELLSIYKRLQAFEAAIGDRPLPKIDRDFMERGGDPA